MENFSACSFLSSISVSLSLSFSILISLSSFGEKKEDTIYE